MTDVAFGIIERRTIIVVLFSIVLASIILGLPLPIRITNAQSLFIDLVLLTGYIYFMRSLLRLPIAFCVSLVAAIPLQIGNFTRHPRRWIDHIEFKPINPLKKNLIILISWSAVVIGALVGIIWALLVYVPWGTFRFEKRRKLIVMFWLAAPKGYSTPTYKSLLLGIFSRLDRAWLIAVSVAVTLPSQSWQNAISTVDTALLRTLPGIYPGLPPSFLGIDYTEAIGILGLLMMLTVFIMSGSFTALVEDTIEKQEQEKAAATIPVMANANHMQIQNVEVSTSYEKPLHVEVVNRTFSPVPVDVRNIVEVHQR